MDKLYIVVNSHTGEEIDSFVDIDKAFDLSHTLTEQSDWETFIVREEELG